MEDCVEKCQIKFGNPFGTSHDVLFHMFEPKPQPDDISVTPSAGQLFNIAVDPKPIVTHLTKKGNEFLLDLFKKCSMLTFLTGERKTIHALRQEPDPAEKVALYFAENRKTYVKKINNLRKCVIKEASLLY